MNSSSWTSILNGAPTEERKRTQKGSQDMSKARRFVFTVSRCQEEEDRKWSNPHNSVDIQPRDEEMVVIGVDEVDDLEMSVMVEKRPRNM